MGIEPTSEAWGSFGNCFESTSQPPSGRRQPLESNRQTFGPLPSPGTRFYSRRVCPFIPTLMLIVVCREPYLAEAIPGLNLGMEGPPPHLRTPGHSLIKPISSHAIRARTAPRHLLPLE
jgi:hypothetical protein